MVVGPEEWWSGQIFIRMTLLDMCVFFCVMEGDGKDGKWRRKRLRKEGVGSKVKGMDWEKRREVNKTEYS